MNWKPSHAPGAPGGPELWNPGSKASVGTSANDTPVWFTVGRGVVEEMYFPHADHPRIRFLGLAVADDADFFSWEQDDTDSEAEVLEVGVPAYRLRNKCRQGLYEVEKEVFAHPARPALVQRLRFQPLQPEAGSWTWRSERGDG